jgi:hypothetical protein
MFFWNFVSLGYKVGLECCLQHWNLKEEIYTCKVLAFLETKLSRGILLGVKGVVCGDSFLVDF